MASFKDIAQLFIDGATEEQITQVTRVPEGYKGSLKDFVKEK